VTSGINLEARADDAKAKPVKVPFELLKTKHITVMVKVNGLGPYRLIFDTGAPVTLLNNKVAKQAGLLKNVKKPAFSLFGAGGTVKVPKLEIGDLTAENVPAVVMDHPTLEAISKKLGPLDGIVGFPFFARYKMTIDYQAKEMTFVPNGFDPPDAVEDMMATVTALLSKDKPEPKVLSASARWGMAVSKDSDDEDAGVIIKKVMPNSPAAAAGLKAGDRLLTLDDRWTDSVADTYEAASHVKPGTAVKVVVKRDGKEQELTVKPSAGL
jgi:membrane-associated protease RseP (regulator of RpoE activity)